MKKRPNSHWGWGFYISLDGDLRDAFPTPETPKEKSLPVREPAKRHVKKKVKRVLAVVQ